MTYLTENKLKKIELEDDDTLFGGTSYEAFDDFAKEKKISLTRLNEALKECGIKPGAAQTAIG